MSDYSEKLKSPKWQKRRLEILHRDNFTCQICGDAETELQIHHKTYSGEPHEALDDELITLCKHCHKCETFASKNSLKIISVFKKGNDFFAKLSDKSLYILKGSKSINNTYTEIDFVIKNPKELVEIINIMF